MHERRKSLRLHTQTPERSGLVTPERKSHAFAHESDEGKDDVQLEAQNLMGSPSRTDISPNRKRKKHHIQARQKKLKRSSVESRTVSVTRIDTPIYEDNFSSALDISSESDSFHKERSAVLSPSDSEPGIMDTNRIDGVSTPHKPSKEKHRKFRVSLSLPDEVEVRPPGIKSPLCDNLISKIASPKSSKSSPSFESDSCFTSSSSVQGGGVGQQQHAAAFIASPLPHTTKKQFGSDTTRLQATPTKSPGAKDSRVPALPDTHLVSTNVVVSKAVDCSPSMSTSYSAMVDESVSATTESILAAVTEVVTNNSSDLMDVGVTGNPIALASSLSVAGCSPLLESDNMHVVIASEIVPLEGTDPLVIDSSADLEDTSPLVIASSADLEDTNPLVIASSANLEDTNPSSSAECITTSHVIVTSSMDVGVTGSSTPAQSSIKTNPVVISTIEVPKDSQGSEKARETDHKDPAGIYPQTETDHSPAPTNAKEAPKETAPDHSKEPPISVPALDCPHQETSHKELSLPPTNPNHGLLVESNALPSQASSSQSRSFLPAPIHATNSSCKQGKPSGNFGPTVTQSPLNVHQNNAKPILLPTEVSPKRRMVAKRPGKDHSTNTPSGSKVCHSPEHSSPKAQSPVRHRPSVLPVMDSTVWKSKGKAAAAPTPVITTTSPQIRSLPQQKADPNSVVISRSDKLTTINQDRHLGPDQAVATTKSAGMCMGLSASLECCIFADKPSESSGKPNSDELVTGTGDNDVIITGVESFAMGENAAQHRPKETATNSQVCELFA